jgi:hypothetical protein
VLWGGKRGQWEGGEITQTLYAHMNKIIFFFKKDSFVEKGRQRRRVEEGGRRERGGGERGYEKKV